MLSRAEVRDVDVRAGPRVVGQIPAWVVGIFVDHDGVVAPVPIIHVVVVVRRDTEIKIVEPEAIAISSAKAVLMAAAKAAGEAAVFPWMIKVIVFVTPAGIMADPRVIVVDVRRFRMIRLIAERTTIFLRTALLRTALLRPSVWWAALGRAIFS